MKSFIDDIPGMVVTIFFSVRSAGIPVGIIVFLFFLIAVDTLKANAQESPATVEMDRCWTVGTNVGGSRFLVDRCGWTVGASEPLGVVAHRLYCSLPEPQRWAIDDHLSEGNLCSVTATNPTARTLIAIYCRGRNQAGSAPLQAEIQAVLRQPQTCRHIDVSAL